MVGYDFNPRTRHIRPLALTLAALLAAPSFPATAQTAGQIVPDSYAPPLIQRGETGVTLPPTAGLDTPAGADKLAVTPSGLEVEGGFPDLAPETATIGARLRGRRVSGADLFAAARELEAAYARAGYLLVRVALPPQTVRDGRPLKLIVTDGHVEAIDASALPEAARKRVEAVLEPLIGKTRLTRGELERRLLLAGDTPGVMLRSTLRKGDAPGATVIVLDGRYDPVTAMLSSDNGLSDNLGRYTVTVGADLNDVLGLGESAYFRLAGYPGLNGGGMFSDDPRNRQVAGGITLPLGTGGLWLNTEGVDSRTHPTSDLGYTMSDQYRRLSARLGFDWVRSRDFNTASVLVFDGADEEQDIHLSGASARWTEDRLRVLRLTQTADGYMPWGGLVSGNVTASFGLDAFGARSGTPALPLSREGAKPDFAKLELSGRYDQPFAGGQVRFSLAGKAQTSFGDPLAASEQFGLGGADWLSAFGGGVMEGDMGAAIRTELAFPVSVPVSDWYPALGGGAAPYVFAAGGVAKLEQPSAVERQVIRAASFGAGIRFGLSEKASPHTASLTLEYAHGSAIGTDGEDRLNLTFAAWF